MNRITMISLGVKDMKASLKFYKDIGFKTFETMDNPPIVFFDNAGTKLALYSLEGLAKDINAENPPKLCGDAFGGITLACNMQTEAEVDDFMALVASKGGEIVKAPQKVFWGGYSGYFKDPNGVYWEVAYGPQFEYDENGMLKVENLVE